MVFLLTYMVDGMKTVDGFLDGPVTNTNTLCLQETRERVVHVLKKVPQV
jgi:hypothetical protein